jgi:hypothetical protein
VGIRAYLFVGLLRSSIRVANSFKIKGIIRMTRLGEFSPIRQWFTVGSVFANYRSSLDVWLFFAMVKNMYKFGQKMEFSV